ncbi:MAG: lysophospholipid acyltransferase family protein [Planctomycetota bacterium]
MALSQGSAERLSAYAELRGPLLIQTNHPSWWDPLIAHHFNRQLLHPRQFVAPIDAEALEQYGVFKKLGFFGVESDKLAGAKTLLRAGRAACTEKTVLWITPEGRFADARDRSAALAPGLAHLCRKLDAEAQGGRVLSMALEYAFWDERLPVVFAHFSQPMDFSTSAPNMPSNAARDKSWWSQQLENQLRGVQNELADWVVARQDDPFEVLVTGRRGAGGVYERARQLKAWWSGAKLSTQHGEQFS